MNYLIQRTYTFTITRDSILFLLVFIFNFSTLPVYLFRSSKRDRRLRAWHVLDCAFVNTNSMHTRVLESNQPTFSYSRVSHFDRLELFIWGADWLQKKKKRRKNTNNSFFLFFFFKGYRFLRMFCTNNQASKPLLLHFPGRRINFHSDIVENVYAILHDTIARGPTYRDPIERNESYSLVTRFEAHHTIFTSNSNLPRRHKTLHQR